MTDYDPQDWFWIVGGDMSRAWSSAIGAYVASYPEDRVTRIASEAELSDVLRAYGLTVPAPVEADYSSAIQTHVDATARARGYSDGYGLASYLASQVPQWAAEAIAFVAWRDAVWLYAYQELSKVQAGQRAQPAVTELIGELPAITWPA